MPPIPGLARLTALEYPDKTAVSVNSSGFHYVVRVDHSFSRKEGERIYEDEARLRAELLSVRDAQGLRREDTIKGEHVSRAKRQGETLQSTTVFDYSKVDAVPGVEEGKKPIFLSKKLGVAHFAAPTWKVINFPAVTTSDLAPGQGQQIKMDREVCFDIRIPDHAAAQTPFAAVVRAIEEAGHDQRMPLAGNNGPAEFEVPWRGATGSGIFTIPIVAIVSPQWITINTVPAMKYLRNMGGNRGDDEAGENQWFPGTLTVTWWIGARPSEPAATP